MGKAISCPYKYGPNPNIQPRKIFLKKMAQTEICFAFPAHIYRDVLILHWILLIVN
jgi:hypothetical protein